MRESKKHGSIHHIIPTSRGGKRAPENEIRVDPRIHKAWHTLFGNLLVEEAITLIRHCWINEDGYIDKKYFLDSKRKKAWRFIFKETDITSKEAVRIIKKNFTNKGT